MGETKRFYKVVKKNGDSPMVCGKYKLNYKIGKKTTPKIGRIFVWDTFYYARIFANADIHEIYECKCEDVRLEQEVPNTYRFGSEWENKDIEDFWRDGKINTVTISEHRLTAKSITLTKKLTDRWKR